LISGSPCGRENEVTRVMNDLMPHMIKDLVPLITQPTIDWLMGRASET